MLFKLSNTKFESLFFRKNYMKYPLNKKQLQEYDLDNISKDRINHTFYGRAPCHDLYVHLYTPSICPKMKINTLEEWIDRIIEELCYDFPQHLYYTFYSRKYVFTPVYIPLSNIILLTDEEDNSVAMNALIEKLNPLFIDCKITSNPKTLYITIEW